MTNTTDRDTGIGTVIGATKDAVATDPAAARALFRASGAGGPGVRTELRAGRHTVVIDEPPALTGRDEAPNPVEAALAGLLAYQVVTYRFWVVEPGIPLDDVAVDVEGDLDVRGFFGLDDGVRPGFTGVRIVVRLSGPAADDDYRRLHTAVDEHCPVLDLFRNPTPVATRLA